MNVRVLEVIETNHAVDLKAELLKSEDFWIRQFITAFPFGLNDKVKQYGCALSITDPMLHKGQPYFCAKVRRKRRSHGKRKRFRNSINIKFEEELKQFSHNVNTGNGIRTLYVYLRKQNAQTLRHYSNVIRQAGCKFDKDMKLIILAYLSGYYASKNSKIRKG